MRKLPITLLCTFMIAPCAGFAAELQRPTLSFDAFGTFGVVHSDEDQADFSGISLNPNGVGHSKDLAVNIDSLIGGQVTANFSDKLTGVVQLISKRDSTGDYTPKVEWANIRYQMTPEFSIRLGRAVLPSFIASTYRNVGYAQHWLRPPIEVYGLVPLTSRDGITLNHTLVREDIFNSLELTYGEKDGELFDGSKLKASESYGISDTLEIGDLTVHASYQTATLSLNTYDALFAGFQAFGAAGAQIAARFDPDNSKITYIGAGLSYDPGQWFLMSEWGQTRSDTIVGISEGAYISGGYRIGRLTPYMTLARARSDSLPADIALNVSQLPPAHAMLAAGLNQALKTIESGMPVQDSVSVGLRWELNRRVALMAQIDHADMLGDSYGNLSNPQPGYNPGGSVNIYSASLSFVFP